MKRFFFIAIMLIIYSTSQSQFLAAFEDHQKQFWAFEAGMFNLLEEDEITNFQVGGTLVAYLDDVSNFKIYQFGQVHTLLEVAQVKYTATDYLLGYSLFDTLFVFDNGLITKLSTDCEEYLVRDSLIVWQNRKDRSLLAYYKGDVTTIADELYEFTFEPFMAGDNIFAWVNSITREFSVFYHGRQTVIDDYADQLTYQAGSDVLAFMDVADQNFNVFYKGDVIELDIYQPNSFQVGDQIVAYLDDLGKLKYFENGQVKTISFSPEFYEVKDHILVYEEQGSFKTVCNGEIYIVEQYIPQPYYLDVNTIAYLEHNESIRVFQHCKHVVANKVDVLKFNMVRDVIVYSENVEEVKVYFNGEVYENK